MLKRKEDAGEKCIEFIILDRIMKKWAEYFSHHTREYICVINTSSKWMKVTISESGEEKRHLLQSSWASLHHYIQIFSKSRMDKQKVLHLQIEYNIKKTNKPQLHTTWMNLKNNTERRSQIPKYGEWFHIHSSKTDRNYSI